MPNVKVSHGIRCTEKLQRINIYFPIKTKISHKPVISSKNINVLLHF